MKNGIRSAIDVSIAAMALTTALAGPAAAQMSLPCGATVAPGCFKGSLQGQDAHDILPPGATSVAIRTTATGVGTRLGQFTLDREITGDLLNFSEAGTAHWVAANGDSIYTTLVGQAELSDLPGGFLKVTEIHTITDGTGRFARAQGSFTVELFHQLQPSEVAGGVETHDVFGSFHGIITSRGTGR